MNRMNYSILLLIIWTGQSMAQSPLRIQYDKSRQHYDIELAIATRDSLNEQGISNPMLRAETCLLIAELYRIEFEDTPKIEGVLRRSLGAKIDKNADEGLLALSGVSESSERYRVEADLIGCKIRTKFKARKYRHKMNDAIKRARNLDPENPNALLTAAKPFLFGRDKKENLITALNLINRAIEIDPTSEQAWLMRGMTYAEMKKTDEAQSDWQKALKVNPYSSLAKTALSGKN